MGKQDWLDKPLEELFNRGYAHGVSGGLSKDGEYQAVTDMKKAIRAEILKRTPNRHK